MKKYIKLLAVYCVVCVVGTGCSFPWSKEPVPIESPAVSSAPAMSSSINEMQDFSSIPEYGGGDEVPVVLPSEDSTMSASSEDDDDALYEIKDDGYAYRLDPQTFEAYGEPLDPETHQPISGTSTEYSGPSSEVEPKPVPSESEPEQEPEPEPSEPVENTEENTALVEPTEETRLPNTGLFLEDD